MFAIMALVVFTLRTSSQATRFELILAKQETENTIVAAGTQDTLWTLFSQAKVMNFYTLFIQLKQKCTLEET